MSDIHERKPLSHGDRLNDGHRLEQLACEFDITADALALELCAIAEWLAHGALAADKPAAFTSAADSMNRARHLLGEIEQVTSRSDRGKA